MTSTIARRIRVGGLVQGVGFRPFVHNLAARLGLGGMVRNTDRGVEIHVEGASAAVQTFLEDLVAGAPALAHVDDVQVEEIAPSGCADFRIDPSRTGDAAPAVVPDVATCAACLREILDPGARRHGYPFTNCTQCGPRFTIVRAVPYDRQRTTMAGFAMCPQCRVEYEDPGDRRFHAQPIACDTCGPRLALVDPGGRAIPGDPLRETRRRLAAGAIVAIKGIGGFHLACDATNEAAVRRLRERKGRDAKPFAVMVPHGATARRLCLVSDEEMALLESRARPIVLLIRRRDTTVAASVAPKLGTLGVMLPYSPLHHLLWRGGAGCPTVLVLTSGNRSDEPIAVDDADALARLGAIADAFLLHDRPIHARCDDSVVRLVGAEALPLRRARGYAPLPVRLPFATPPILACGADLKSAIGLARGHVAVLSPHLGDLQNYETYAASAAMIDHLTTLFQIHPQIVAHDLHPGYLSTRLGRAFPADLPRVAVQHHHAHVAACMAEHGLTGPVIGVAFDGTGYGLDGAIWGGEFLVADYARFRRAAHLAYVPMPGADRAVREPLRMALAHLAACGEAWDPALPSVASATDAERQLVGRQLDRRLNAPMTSSVGRLFDAVASLLDVRHRAQYEGQAAIELEALAADGEECSYPIALGEGEPLLLDPAPIIRAVVRDLKRGTGAPVVAARFQATVVAAILAVSERLRQQTGLDRVALSGGVFQNVAVLTRARAALSGAGFAVFTHRVVPPNDGGIALGQAAVAHARLG